MGDGCLGPNPRARQLPLGPGNDLGADRGDGPVEPRRDPRIDRLGPVHPDERGDQPHWNTATITPYVAPIDSRFMIAALTGTATERNTDLSKRNDSRRPEGYSSSKSGCWATIQS
jgi:hypothetical protein